MENKKCNLCGSLFYKDICHIQKWKILQCIDCGLLYLDSPPESAEIEELARAYYITHKSVAQDYDQIEKLIRGQNTRLKFVERYAKGARLLDVGCGPGYFLACVQGSGWETEGVEPSSLASDFARTKLNLNVKTGALVNVRLEKNPYDIITMWHSLEHAVDPFGDLSMLHGMLTPEGVLIIDTPNNAAFDFRHHPDRINWMDVPFHLFFFNPRSLRMMLQKANFKIIKEIYAPSMAVHLISKNYFRTDNFWRRLISAIPARVLRGRDMVFVAKKKSCQ